MLCCWCSAGALLALLEATLTSHSRATCVTCGIISPRVGRGRARELHPRDELSKIAFANIRLGHEKAHLFAPITTLAEGATHALRLAMHQVAVALSIRLPTRRPGSGVPWSRASPLNSMLKAFSATRARRCGCNPAARWLSIETRR